MQDLEAVDVPLQFANEGLFLHHSLKLDHAAAVAHRGRQLVGRHGERDIRLAVAVENRWNGTCGPQPARIALAMLLPLLNVQSFRHALPFNPTIT